MTFRKQCPSCGNAIRLGGLKTNYYDGEKIAPWYRPANPRYFCKSCDSQIAFQESNKLKFLLFGLILTFSVVRYGLHVMMESGFMSQELERTLFSLAIFILLLAFSFSCHWSRKYVVAPKRDV